MRAQLLTVAIVASLLAGVSQPSRAVAQQTNAGANASRFGIGVVDISYIFKKHLRFKANMEQMKGDVKTAEEQLRQERQKIGQREESLKRFNAGSPDYKQLEEQIAEEKARFNLKAAKQRKDFLEREAKIYYQTYLEVNDAVKYIAQQKKLGLVLRFNGDPVNPNKRDHVLRVINKPVVFQGGIDITPEILAAVNRGGSKTPVNQARRPAIPGRPTR